MGSRVGGDYPGRGCVLVCVGWIDMCGCVQGWPFDMFEWVLFVHVGVYLFVLCAMAGTGACMGMAVWLVLLSLGWFLPILDHVSYTVQKLWLSFQTPQQMISQTDTARCMIKILWGRGGGWGGE